MGLLVYGYASGVFSRRKLERSTFESVVFRFVSSNQHPDHDTVAAFRCRFPPRTEALFVEVLQTAQEMGPLKLGTIGLDGTEIQADASLQGAPSREHADGIGTELKAEGADLMARAEAADRADVDPRRIGTARGASGADRRGEGRGRATGSMPPTLRAGSFRRRPTAGGGFDHCTDAQAAENPTPLDATRHRPEAPEGRDHCAERKHTPEPVFGIIKPVLGFRQSSSRGLDGMRGGWSLVTTARAMERMFKPSRAAA